MMHLFAEAQLSENFTLTSEDGDYEQIRISNARSNLRR